MKKKNSQGNEENKAQTIIKQDIRLDLGNTSRVESMLMCLFVEKKEGDGSYFQGLIFLKQGRSPVVKD